MAINEMCNYITACCCHLENWYFVTHKLFPILYLFLLLLILTLFRSCFIVYVKRFLVNMQVKIIRKKYEDHHYTDSCIACQFTFLSAKKSCDRDCFQGWYTHSAVIRLLSNDRTVCFLETQLENKIYDILITRCL